MTLPTHGNIVRLVDAKKRKRWFIGIGDDLGYVLLEAYSKKIDKLCCVKCSEKEHCKMKDGSCWESVE